MTIAAYYDSDNDKVVFNKNVELQGNLTVAGTSPVDDIEVSTAGSEYFQAELTDYQILTYNNSSANSSTVNVFDTVDFEGKGTQTGNTTNWDATNNAYTLGSDGLYQINFTVQAQNSYTTPNGTYFNDAQYDRMFAYVEYSTDNFSNSTVIFGANNVPFWAGANIYNQIKVSNSYIFSPASANTKVRLKAAAGIKGGSTSYFPVLVHSGYSFNNIFNDQRSQSLSTTEMNTDIPGITNFSIVRLQ